MLTFSRSLFRLESMDDEERTTKLTLTGEISFSQSITKSQAGQIIAFLGTQIPMAASTPAYSAINLPAATQSAKKFETPRTAIDETGARTNPEKIVALASYVLQEGTGNTFTLDDIKPLFKRAGEVTPKNIGRDLITAIKAGYIAESDQRGDYYFTKKAINATEGGFEAKAIPKKRKRSSNRSHVSTPQPISDEIKTIEITTTIAEYPGFYELKTKSDKFLWVLTLAKKSNIGSLSASEIVFISDAIGEGIPSNDVTSYFRSNQKKGFVTKSMQDNKIRLIPPGEEYLKKQGKSGTSNG